jgi:nitroreductase/NAD-dependent dihydropyrimidine dehydrogenase PreA subunit
MVNIDFEKCNGCGICRDVCPSSVIGAREVAGKRSVYARYPEMCNECGHCMAACPREAITFGRVSYDDFEKLKPNDISAGSMRNLLLSRRSVRQYRKEPVPDSVTDQLIEVATHAGTGGNLQSVGFIVVKDREVLARLETLTLELLWNSGLKLIGKEWILPLIRLKFGRETTDQLQRYHTAAKRLRDNDELEGAVFRNAPMAIFAHDLKSNTMGQVNCAIAIRNMEVMAMTMGLGSCWAGFLITAANLRHRKVNAFLGLDDSRRIRGALMVGYPKYTYDFKFPRAERSLTVL